MLLLSVMDGKAISFEGIGSEKRLIFREDCAIMCSLIKVSFL